MQEDEIKFLADKLIESAKEPQAYFGIGEKGEDYFFEGNKQGMRLFAAELLYASMSDSKTWGIQNEWFDGTALEIDRIERTDANGLAQPEVTGSNIMNYLIPIGCGAVVLIGTIFLIVGAIETIRTVINWL